MFSIQLTIKLSAYSTSPFLLLENILFHIKSIANRTDFFGT